MYQFYYSKNENSKKSSYQKSVSDYLKIDAVKPTMWEEHCLECSAPACYKTCPHYIARSDGRCKRFTDGYNVTDNQLGNCKQSARVGFLPWSNMMTIVFPGTLETEKLEKLNATNQKVGRTLRTIARSFFPPVMKWESIRTVEYIRRRYLRKAENNGADPNYFVFHGYSFEEKPYNLIIEFYEDNKPVYKKSLLIDQGENLYTIAIDDFSSSCLKNNNLIKVYPENDLEAELEILWCDFVHGQPVNQSKPANFVKCVVWDLDCTIWDGILLETEDAKSLRLRDSVVQTIKELDERGIIQSIASKNDFNEAWAQLERLNIAEYFLYPQINWNPKSSSIRQIANNLNINLDTFALIDDSVFERNQVHSELPQVRVYDENTIGGLLLNRAEFNVMVTAESKNRRKMYKAEEIRNQELNRQHGDVIEFLKSCSIEVEMFKPEEQKEKDRCFELVVRTNQLNMTGNKYNRETFDSLLNDESLNTLAFKCKDKYGEYGIVGFIHYVIENDVLIFREFTMSCRVSGKYIESSILRALLEAHNCEKGIFPINKTNRNYLLRNTINEINCPIIDDSDGVETHTFNKELKHSDIAEVHIHG